MKKHCVINFATNAWYPRGQQRLVESLKEHGFSGDVLTFDSEGAMGCPTHQQAPYAFKPYALKYAYEKGYERILWADASVWAIKPIESVFRYLEEHSHMLFVNANTGTFTSDACLKEMGVDREESFNMTMLMGICMGFNMTHEVCQSFLADWFKHANDGITFPGKWTNDDGSVSSDPRVKGHRHDQSVASILAHRRNMELIVAHYTFMEYLANPWPNHEMPKVESVCLAAQGM